MQSLVSEHFTLRVDLAGGPDERVLRVAWLGRCDERQPAVTLQPFFTALLEEATAADLSLAFRFEILEHFNSATIAVLMQFVRAAGEHRVPLSLTYDPGKKWQKLTFDALRRFEDPTGHLRVLATGSGDGGADAPG